MGNLTLNGATSGQITLTPTAVAGTNTITLPAATGTVLTTAGGQNVNTSIGLNGATSGTITLQATTVAGTNTITLPANSGTAITTRSAGTVLQVVTANKTDTFSTSSTSFTDITGLSVSITPSSATNKILIMASVNGTGASGVVQAMIQLVRNSTAIDIGDAASTRIQTTNLYTAAADGVVMATPIYLDSPATTASTTYKVQMRVNSSTGYVNRTTTDSDTTVYSRTASTITVMEIAA